jgi:hypothetical protein
MMHLHQCIIHIRLTERNLVWDELGEKHFGNKMFKSMDALMDAPVEGIMSMKASPGVLKSLTQRDWMKK